MARLQRAALLLFLTAVGAQACTTIIVGKQGTSDGSVLIARNDDGEDARTDQNKLVWHPSREDPAVFRSNVNKLVLELPGPGLGYMALPVMLADEAAARNASSESSGVNEAGVALTATESIYNSKAALAADPYVPDGIIEDVIPSVLLPQATSAREGMALLGRLVLKYGAGEGFGVAIADSKEAWYIETAGGHHWLAQRIPGDSYFHSANQGRFTEVDFSDDANIMSSPGLLEHAIKNKLYDPNSGKPFSFYDAFIDQGSAQHTYSWPRVWRLHQLLGHFSSDTSMPVFHQPAAPLAPADIFWALRDHFQHSPHDPYAHQNPDEPWRPIAVLRSGNGHVIRLRTAGRHLPEGLSAIHYIAQAMPALSPFVPIYSLGLGGGELPAQMASPTSSEPDATSLFWRARTLQALVFQNWPLLFERSSRAIATWEREVEGARRPAMELEYRRMMAESNAEGARHLLARWTEEVVASACELLTELAKEAAKGLGFEAIPADSEIVKMLDDAEGKFGFLPPEANDNAMRAHYSVPSMARLSMGRRGGADAVLATAQSA